MAGRQRYSHSVLIGLGGTGQKVLLETKRSLMAANGGKVPEEIVFLAIDTDKPYDITDPYTDEKIGFEHSEFLRLIGNGSARVAMDAEKPGGWWPRGVTDWPLPGAGAAAKRMHGRAKLGLSIRNVARKIQSAIAACKKASRNRPDFYAQGEVRVTIICSVAGGTGAGCWLDVANLVHENVELERGDMVWGIMLLGDAFDGLRGTRNKYANTVACLRELQWLMEDILGDDDKEKRYELNERKMNFPDAKIFNLCSLVTTKNKNGDVVGDSELLLRMIGRYVFHMCGPAGNEFLRMTQMAPAPPFYGADGYSKRQGVFSSFGISELFNNSEEDLFKTLSAETLEDLIHRAAPLCTYDPGIVVPGATEEICGVVGPGDNPPPNLDVALKKESFDLNCNTFWATVTDADYLAVLRWEYGAPGYALGVLKDMGPDYDNDDLWAQCKVGFHLNGEWRKNLPSLWPDNVEEERRTHWAIANALDIIKLVRGSYEVRNTIGKGTVDAEDYCWFRLKRRSHQDAKTELIADKPLCDNLNEQWLAILNSEGIDAFNAKLKEWARQLSDTINKTSGDSDRKKSMLEDLRLLNKFLKGS